MSTFISLVKWTEQGIRNVKDTLKRAEDIKTAGKKTGVNVKEIYWTMGRYDIVTVMEAPDSESITAFMLSIGSLGNARTETLVAYNADDMRRIISKMQ